MRTLLTLLLLACALAWPGAARAERYTLAGLVTRIQREAPSVVAARATVAMRRAQLLEQQLRWLPEGESRFFATSAPNVRCIDSMGSSTADDRLNDCRTTTVVDLARSAPGYTLADRAPFSGPLLSWSVGLRQPLFTSMKIENAIGSTRGGLGVDEANQRTAELDVGVNAVRVFTQIKTARAAVSTLETALGVVRNFAEQVERELEGQNRGHYTESDEIRLRIQRSNLEQQRLDQQRNADAALDALRALTGDPAADVDESELDYRDRPIEEARVWRERMIDARPEMQYGRAGMRYYTAWHRLQLGWALPDAAMITGIGWGYAPTIDLPNIGYASLPASALGGAFGFAIRQPLDVGPKLLRYFAVGREMEQQRSRFQLGIAYWTLEVDKAWLDVDEARRRLVENLRGEKLTQGWYASVDENLALGLYPDGRELVEVIINWCGFRIRRVQAVADTLVALANLRRLSGQPILDGGAL